MYGNEIKKARNIYGATQMQVSQATGLPQNTISWIELDKGIPNIQQCVLLAKYFGCTLDELIGLSDTIGEHEAQKTVQPRISNSAVNFANEFEDIITDNNFVSISKLYKAINPQLRGLILGYIIGILQSQGVNTKSILGY